MIELKKRVLRSGLPSIVKHLNRLAFTNDIYKTDIYTSCYELGYSSEEIKEAIKINNAYYARRKRIIKRINEMIDFTFLNKNSFILFMTFTLNEDHIDLSLKTLRVYLQRLLNDTCISYIANVDFGSLRGRLHYHAVVLVDKNYEWFELWKKRGYVKLEHVIIDEHSVNKLAKYVAKLSAHAIKESTRFETLIYSRRKKNEKI